MQRAEIFLFQRNQKLKIISGLIVLILFCLIQGCATQAPRTEGQSLTGDVTEKLYYWWFARYRIAWPEGTEPDWRVDLMLADAVIKPVLNANRQEIRYWRFHRRAIRDGGGHLFSFIFYTDRDTAGRIYAALTNDKLTKRFIGKKVLERVETDNPENNRLSGVQDTSDKNWPETLQIAWPAYIMGVSDMWLQLIGQNVDAYAPDADVDELLQRYGDANDKITALWQKAGQHAFLHHLNAIFGYEPITINEPIRF